MTKASIPQDLIKRIEEGRCIAFVGAGLSVAAGLPNWPGLMRNLIKWCDDHAVPLASRIDLETLLERSDFLTLGNQLVESISSDQFQKFMESEFFREDLTPTEAHHLLTGIPFRAVITTNYDCLTENAYRTGKEAVSVSTFTHLDKSKLASALQNSEFYILKAHGDITLPNSLVLSRKQYRQLMHSNEAYKKHMESVLTSNSMLFLGFSLTDPDLLMLLDVLITAFEGTEVTHYALMDATSITSVEIDRYSKDYGIQIIPYTASSFSHPEVLEFLRDLGKSIRPKIIRSIEQAGKQIEEIDDHLRLVANTKGEFSIEEKYPGAAENADLSFKITIRKEAFEAWQRLEETGEEITISGRDIESIEMPEILKKAFGENFFLAKEIKAGTYQDGQIIPVRLRMKNGDGSEETIENVELVAVAKGTKQAVLKNKDQTSPVQIQLGVRWEDRAIDFSFRCQFVAMNVREGVALNRFLAAASIGGTFIIEDTKTGLPIGTNSLVPGTIKGQSEEWTEITEALLFIQQSTGISFDYPDVLARDEIKDIFETAYTLRHGKVTGSFKCKIVLPREVVEKLSRGIGDMFIIHNADHYVKLQEKMVPIGQMWVKAEHIRFASDEQERVSSILDASSEPDVLCEVSTSSEHDVTVYYPELLCEEEFEKLFSLPEYRQHSLASLLSTMIEVAKDDSGVLNVDTVAEFFGHAKEQKSRYGTPYNMFGRYLSDELIQGFENLSLDSNELLQVITVLEGRNLIDASDLTKLRVLVHQEDL